MAVFGDRNRVEALEAENASLRQWVEYLKGTDAATLADRVAATQAQLVAAQRQVGDARTELSRVQAQLAAEQTGVVETREIAMLQEVGIYAYRHPVDSALAYRQRLEETRARMKQLVGLDQAVDAGVGWTVNNSREQGERMTRDFKKLMLRAYNAEADNAVRTLKPHTLDRAIERLTKVRATIARLETIMAIQVSEDYHRLRMYELELTADYLSKVEEEKERVRAYANGSQGPPGVRGREGEAA